MSLSGLWVGAGLVSGLVMAFLIQHHHVRKINRLIQTFLTDRRLEKDLLHVCCSRHLPSLVRQLRQLFAYCSTFDQLKSDRVAIETHTLTTLCNEISEATLLLNANQTVLSINSHAEQIFKLIPGESLGQVISRHVSHKPLLDAIATAIADDQRLLDQSFTLSDDKPMIISLIPLKKKTGPPIRLLLVMKHPQP